MNKLAIFTALLLVPIGLFSAFVWYFSVQLDPQVPSSAKIETLENDVSIDWHRAGTTITFSTSDLDAYRALGFAHATRNPWMLSLLRQMAIGEVGTWFESDLSTLDSVVQVLNIADLSQQAAASLSQRSAAILDAYSDGVTAAFDEGKIYRNESFLSIGVNPEAWKPWHSLAIEKLLAWIAAADGVNEQAHTHESELLKGTREVSRFLQVGGFANSASWSVRNTDSTLVGVRLNPGASKLPIFIPTRLVGDNTSSHQVVSILGTPFDVLYKDETSGYALIPSGSAETRTVITDSSRISYSYGRIRHFDGRENLVTRTTIDDDHVLGCEIVAIDPLEELQDDRSPDPNAATLSCTVVSWEGFGAVTDAESWTRSSSNPNFELWNIKTSRFTREGRASLEDASWLPSAFGNRIAAHGTSEWTPFLRSRLVALTSEPEWSATDISSDQKSSWAEATSNLLVDALQLTDTTLLEVSTALTYLRNWDHSYSRSSIAASILEKWTELVTKDTLFALLENDVTAQQVSDLSIQSEHTLDTLAAEFGADMSEWRWESVNAQVLSTPAWTFIADDESNSIPYRRIISRNGPVPGMPTGHPSSISWNESRSSHESLNPVAFYVLINSAQFDDVVYEYQTTRGYAEPQESGPSSGRRYHINLRTAETVGRTELRP